MLAWSVWWSMWHPNEEKRRYRTRSSVSYKLSINRVALPSWRFLQTTFIKSWVATKRFNSLFPPHSPSHLSHLWTLVSPRQSRLQRLNRQMPSAQVKHNFYKYLVNREGVAVKFFTKPKEPLSLKQDIEELLNMSSPRKHARVRNDVRWRSTSKAREEEMCK